MFGNPNPFGSRFEIEFFGKTPSELAVTYRVREEELDGGLLGGTQTVKVIGSQDGESTRESIGESIVKANRFRFDRREKPKQGPKGLALEFFHLVKLEFIVRENLRGKFKQGANQQFVEFYSRF